jgi:hypothetical protein
MAPCVCIGPGFLGVVGGGDASFVRLYREGCPAKRECASVICVGEHDELDVHADAVELD